MKRVSAPFHPSVDPPVGKPFHTGKDPALICGDYLWKLQRCKSNHDCLYLLCHNSTWLLPAAQPTVWHKHRMTEHSACSHGA